MTILFIILAIIFIIDLISRWIFSSALHTKIVLLHKRIDQIFTVDVPTPNKVGDAPELNVDFSASENILDLPRDLKLEVEGGDSQIPPGYEN